MDLEIVLEPTAAGLAVAAAAVAAGAPMFAEGLRSVRLARGFKRLRQSPLAESESGLVHVSGQVVLESPLFSPLSGTPCAGYRLELRAADGARLAPIETFRPFRLRDDGVVARIHPEAGRFDLAETAKREIGPGDTVSENLAALIASVPEAQWMRANGAALAVSEHALEAGATCHVVGVLRQTRAPALLAEEVLARTGTDDVPVAAVHTIPESHDEPDAWIGAGEHLGFLLVSDQAPDPRHFRVGPLRAIGAFAGPVLSLGGLLYLANAAERFRALGH